MCSSTTNIAGKILYFGSRSQILSHLKKIFPEHSILQADSLEEVFKIVASSPLSGLLFETYQIEPYYGVNPTDLDVLLYFVSSDESAKKDVPILPIDPPYSDQDIQSHNFASYLYEDVYDKYLCLLPATELQELSIDSFDFSEGMALLNSLVETLDDATEELDKKFNKTSWSGEDENTVIGKTTLNLQEESHCVSGVEDEEAQEAFTVAGDEGITEESQRISGSKEDLAEDSQRVSGSKEDLAEDSQRISGSQEDLAEDSQRISGSQEDLAEDSQRISGSQEDLAEDSQRISGSQEDLAEDSQRISGSQEDLAEGSQKIKGTKEDLTEESQVIAGSKENTKEEKFIISSDESSDQSPGYNKVKSSTEHISDGFYELKTTNEENTDPCEDDTSVQDINYRNELGQTPIMVFALKGESEKVISLIKAGADTDLSCKEGKTVLHYACRKAENIELIKDLVETFDCKVSKRDSNGLDPLFDAIRGDNDLAIEFLVAQGARLTSKYEGSTYLHVAADANKFKAFKALLTNGANPDQRDHKGKSVYDFVRSKKNVPFLKLLEAFKRLKAKQAA